VVVVARTTQRQRRRRSNRASPGLHEVFVFVCIEPSIQTKFDFNTLTLYWLVLVCISLYSSVLCSIRSVYWFVLHFQYEFVLVCIEPSIQTNTKSLISIHSRCIGLYLLVFVCIRLYSSVLCSIRSVYWFVLHFQYEFVFVCIETSIQTNTKSLISIHSRCIGLYWSVFVCIRLY
jgi:hypothetical protein